MNNFKDYKELSEVISEDIFQLKPDEPVVVFMSALQGFGKTTLSSLICESLSQKGLSAFTCSVDDFYLTNSDRVKLNDAYGLFEYRGCPGSHEPLLLRRLIESHVSQTHYRVPIFDKHLLNGKGDRSGHREYHPSDVLIVEGWFMGVESCDLLPDNSYRRFLKDYDNLWSFGDYWILFNVDRGISLEGRKRAEKQASKSSEVNITNFLDFMWSSVSPEVIARVLKFDGGRFRRGCRIKLMPDYTGTVELVYP